MHRKHRPTNNRLRKKLDLRQKIASVFPTEDDDLREKTIHFPLSATDKLTCIYKVDNNGNIREVNSATYSTKIGKDWEMVVYFDDVHRLLHRHRRVTLENDFKILDFPLGIGSNDHKRNLRYAMNDIEKNYYFYRRHLLKASKEFIKKGELDIYYD